MKVVARLRLWAGSIRRDVHALYLAAHDPRVPWYVKAIAIVVAVYALSPIDLIPDFIPVLGLLDEAILLPLAIKAMVYLIPPEIMAEHRATAVAAERRSSRAGAAIVIGLWVAFAAALTWLFWPTDAS
ncbi:MAG: DUF1232 domain-containing protein [Alphaproteobacteria bacterium]|nr:DUF1232 domain-containing protein [Alphaproteobacteria bacterium]